MQHMMSSEYDNAIGIDVIYIAHHCNIAQFLMAISTKFYCISMSIIEEGVVICSYLPIKQHFI